MYASFTVNRTCQPKKLTMCYIQYPSRTETFMVRTLTCIKNKKISKTNLDVPKF